MATPRRTARLAVFVSAAVAPEIRSTVRLPPGAPTCTLAPVAQGTRPAVPPTTSQNRRLSLMTAPFLPFVQDAVTFLTATYVTGVVIENGRKLLRVVPIGDHRRGEAQ